MQHLTVDEMKDAVQAEIKRRNEAFIAAVQDGRGAAILARLRPECFMDYKSPLTTVNGVVDVHATLFNLGQQKSYMDLARMIEFATQEPAARPIRAVSALSGSGDTN